MSMIGSLRRVAGADDARPARGQVLPIFALFLIVLLGFTALAVDYGTYLLARREYQNVADAGALAGTSYLVRPLTPAKHDDARTAAWEAVKDKLGLTEGTPTEDALAAGVTTTDGWTVWIATPPTDAATYLGDSSISGDSSVYVRVERDNPAFLSRIFGINGRRIHAWATAGNQPSRWAVIALCPRNGCPRSAPQSISLSGSTTQLEVVDGDMGSNWGLHINSNADDRLQLPDDSRAYISEVVDTYCGPSTFLCASQGANVSDGAGTARSVLTLPAPVPDPNYPEPPLTDVTVPPRPAPRSQDVTGTVLGSGQNVRCSGGGTIIGPGRYDALIDVPTGKCVIFDPTYQLSDGQMPGIFWIRGGLSINEGAFVIGDGVTVFFDYTLDTTNPRKPFNPGGGIVINQGNADIADIPSTDSAKWGAWTTLGHPTWSTAVGPPLNATTSWIEPTGREIGMAFYVRRDPAGSKTKIFNMSGSSPLLFRGVLYGPADNVSVSGAGEQAAVGQIVGWTVGYFGTTVITQTYDGPTDTRAYLLEPRTGQPD